MLPVPPIVINGDKLDPASVINAVTALSSNVIEVSTTVRVDVFNLSAANLKKWRAAFGRARNGGAVARIAVVSDSTGRGAWSNGTSGTNVVPTSWPTYLAKAFTAFGYTGSSDSVFGDGTFGVPLSTIDGRVTLTGGWSASSVKSLGGNALLTTATGNIGFTPKLARTSYDVFYIASGGNGTFAMDIGGAGSTPVNTGSSGLGFLKATITGTSSVSPLNISYSSGNSIFVIGWEGRDPSDIVSVINMGRSGSKVADWTASTGSPWDSLIALPVVGPDLTIICLTINDWVAGTSIATYTAQMQSLITAALLSGDVLLMTGIPSNTANASLAAQAEVTNACYSLATANKLPLVDLAVRFQSYAISQPLGFYGDTSLHNSGVANCDIAGLLLKTLTS